MFLPLFEEIPGIFQAMEKKMTKFQVFQVQWEPYICFITSLTHLKTIEELLSCDRFFVIVLAKQT